MSVHVHVRTHEASTGRRTMKFKGGGGEFFKAFSFVFYFMQFLADLRVYFTKKRNFHRPNAKITTFGGISDMVFAFSFCLVIF